MLMESKTHSASAMTKNEKKKQKKLKAKANKRAREEEEIMAHDDSNIDKASKQKTKDEQSFVRHGVKRTKRFDDMQVGMLG